MRLIATLALLALSLTVTAQAPEPEDPNKADLKALQGTWQMIKAVKEGKATDKDIKGVTMVIEKDTLTIKDGKRDEQVKIKVDPSKKPHQIDLEVGKGKIETVKGIYKLEKDELSIRFAERGKDRPTSFDTKGEGGLLVFKRKK